jgi:peptide/nickel transport system substrate-binding protein
MTASAIPELDTELSGLQGYEGYRFVGNSLYDGLTRFNLLQSTQVPAVVPDLATSWTSNATATVWTFTLRPNVTFQDGTQFNAAALVFTSNATTTPRSSTTTLPWQLRRRP